MTMRASSYVSCTYDPETKSGTPGAEKVKVKGNIHWVSARHAYAAEVRLYDRLFKVPHPDGRHGFFAGPAIPTRRKLITAQLEPALKEAKRKSASSSSATGYYVADSADSLPGEPRFNRTVGLRDTWQK
jgi:glutaminyl-tRNA synthetase